MDESSLLSDAFAIINDVSTGMFSNVDGVDKFERRVQKEIETIESLKNKKILTKNHIKCSNLHHLQAIHKYISKIPEVISIRKNFSSKADGSVVVDIVANNGFRWYKVILRNPKALHQIYTSGSKKGIPPLNEVAEKYVRVAQENKLLFSIPNITFIFERGISSSIGKELENLGVQISGEIFPDRLLGISEINSEESDSDIGSKVSDNYLYSEEETLSVCSIDNVNKLGQYDAVNIDVTCLIAYTSETSNGGYDYTFKDPLLNDQADWERRCPVKSILEKYFAGKVLLLCQEAAEHFKMIMSTIGGTEEMERGLALLEKCSIIESKDILHDQLPIGGRIKSLSRKIFGTGHFHEAPTITSNEGFLRAAENKGVKLAVLLHGPRALTELKGKAEMM